VMVMPAVKTTLDPCDQTLSSLDPCSSWSPLSLAPCCAPRTTATGSNDARRSGGVARIWELNRQSSCVGTRTERRADGSKPETWLEPPGETRPEPGGVTAADEEEEDGAAAAASADTRDPAWSSASPLSTPPTAIRSRSSTDAVPLSADGCEALHSVLCCPRASHPSTLLPASRSSCAPLRPEPRAEAAAAAALPDRLCSSACAVLRDAARRLSSSASTIVAAEPPLQPVAGATCAGAEVAAFAAAAPGKNKEEAAAWVESDGAAKDASASTAPADREWRVTGEESGVTSPRVSGPWALPGAETLGGGGRQQAETTHAEP
jgi:hypothetical protein